MFNHEKESLSSPDSENLKLKTIADIKADGFEVEKIIINSNLTEEEAFVAEASLINAFNYVNNTGLTNIVAGHHSKEALSVYEYERIYGAVLLEEKDIRHRILVIKVSKFYKKGMDEKTLYDTVRGLWRISKEKVKKVEDERYEKGLPLDENQLFYINKSIAGFKLNKLAQNPITYLEPQK